MSSPAIRSTVPLRVTVVVAIPVLLIGGIVGVFVWDRHHGFRLDGVQNVDLKTLGSFPFDSDTGTIENVPKDARALNGKTVALEGFMYTAKQSAGKVDRFQLVYNTSTSSFRGPPLVQERVFVTVMPPAKFEHTDQMVRLTGVLHVKVQRDEVGRCVGLFTMDAEKLEPV